MQVTITKFELEAAINPCINMIRYNAEQKGLYLKFDSLNRYMYYNLYN